MLHLVYLTIIELKFHNPNIQEYIFALKGFLFLFNFSNSVAKSKLSNSNDKLSVSTLIISFTKKVLSSIKKSRNFCPEITSASSILEFLQSNLSQYYERFFNIIYNLSIIFCNIKVLFHRSHFFLWKFERKKIYGQVRVCFYTANILSLHAPQRLNHLDLFLEEYYSRNFYNREEYHYF